MTNPFQRIDVTQWPIIRRETLGQSPTTWVRDPELPHVAENEWLFKPVETHGDGTVQGTDWAEKASSELGRLLGVPTAEIELAVNAGEMGSISRNVRPKGFDMQPGSLWLDADPRLSYSASKSTKSKRVRGATPGYNFPDIALSLDSVASPPGFDELMHLDGLGVFSGYLMLDALIANRDRHEENWSVLRPTTGSSRASLAPSYDLAGTLGYQLTDESRERFLTGHDFSVAKWAARGDAWRFGTGDVGKQSLVELARHALHSAGETAELHWIGKLDSFTTSDAEGLFERLPQMSEASRKFALALIATNAERILDGYRNSAARQRH